MMRRLAVFFLLVLAGTWQTHAQANDARVRWRNGDELAGQLVSATADKVVWKTAVSSQDVTLDLSALDAITTPADDAALLDPSATAFRAKLALIRAVMGGLARVGVARRVGEAESGDGNCDLTCHDGTTFSGDLVGIQNNSITLKSGFAPEPWTIPLAAVGLCKFKNAGAEPLPHTGHQLEHAGLSVRGTLTSAESALGWQFVGADAPIPLDLNQPLTIRRTQLSDAGTASDNTSSDLLLLKSGDRLDCTIESIEPEFLVFSTTVGTVSRIPHDEVRAVSFDGEHVQQVVGFEGDAWQISGSGRGDKSVTRRDDALIFHESGTAIHPTLLAGGNLEFDVTWNRDGVSQLVLSLPPKQQLMGNGRRRFVARNEGMGLVIEPNRPTFYLQFNSNEITVMAIEGNVGHGAQARQLREKGPIRMRLRRQERRLILSLNDEDQAEITASDDQEDAVGVMISVSQQNQQQQRPLGLPRNRRRPGGGAAAVETNLTISNLQAGGGDGLFFHLPILKAAKEYVVTVPRMRRDHPPSHILIGRNGDVLRGHMQALGPTSVQFESGLNDVVLPRDQLAGVVWLTEPAPVVDGKAEPQAAVPTPMPERGETVRAEGEVLAKLTSGASLTLSSADVQESELIARHAVLGECRVPLVSIEMLVIGSAPHEPEQIVQRRDVTEWTLIHAPEPVIPGDNGGFGTYSELVGQPADDFSLALLSGGHFRLSDHRGEVVVLDFWATWCGPCIQALPQIMAAAGAFPDRVRLVTVNQEETPETVREFLESRKWDVDVALDNRGEVGRKFRMQGIPQTVVIGRDGTIEHVHLGASPDLESSLKQVLERLVNDRSGL